MTKRALLISSSKFSSTSNLVDLPTVSATARDLGKALSYCGYPPARVSPLSDPTLEEVVENIEDLMSEELDQMLIYYGGHGARGSAGELLLSLPTTRKGPYSQLSWMPYRAVHAAMENARSSGRVHSVVVLLDCCYAGLADSFRTPTVVASQAEGSSGTCIIAACLPNELAIAPAAQHYTIFGGALINLILRGDATLPPEITWGEAAKLLTQSIEPSPVAYFTDSGSGLRMCRNRSASPIPRTALRRVARPSGRTVAMGSAVAGAGIAAAVFAILDGLADDFDI